MKKRRLGIVLITVVLGVMFFAAYSYTKILKASGGPDYGKEFSQLFLPLIILGLFAILAITLIIYFIKKGK